MSRVTTSDTATKFLGDSPWMICPECGAQLAASSWDFLGEWFADHLATRHSHD